jgi:hypothetical protein
MVVLQDGMDSLVALVVEEEVDLLVDLVVQVTHHLLVLLKETMVVMELEPLNFQVVAEVVLALQVLMIVQQQLELAELDYK